MQRICHMRSAKPMRVVLLSLAATCVAGNADFIVMTKGLDASRKAAAFRYPASYQALLPFLRNALVGDAGDQSDVLDHCEQTLREFEQNRSHHQHQRASAAALMCTALGSNRVQALTALPAAHVCSLVVDGQQTRPSKPPRDGFQELVDDALATMGHFTAPSHLGYRWHRRMAAQLGWKAGSSAVPADRRTARACRGTVLMVENRTGRALSTARVHHYAKTIALNSLYARRHNYSFVVLRPSPGPWLESGSHAAWCKLKAVRSLMTEANATACHWIMVLDSDAVVREQHVDFMQLLGLEEESRALALAREDPNSPIFHVVRGPKSAKKKKAPTMNTGVMFVRAGGLALRLFQTWAEARHAPICRQWDRVHPFEQGCLEILLNASGSKLAAELVDAVRLDPMTIYNSPYGSFVRHIWGGPGRPLRRAGGALDDEMRVQGLWTNQALQKVLDEVAKKHVKSLPC